MYYTNANDTILDTRCNVEYLSIECSSTSEPGEKLVVVDLLSGTARSSGQTRSLACWSYPALTGLLLVSGTGGN